MYQPESVKLYVKPVCGWCRQAEHWLKSQGIEFETIDVMEDPKAFEYMEQISGQTLAPVIEVDGLVLVRVNWWCSGRVWVKANEFGCCIKNETPAITRLVSFAVAYSQRIFRHA